MPAHENHAVWITDNGRPYLILMVIRLMWCKEGRLGNFKMFGPQAHPGRH